MAPSHLEGGPRAAPIMAQQVRGRVTALGEATVLEVGKLEGAGEGEGRRPLGATGALIARS
jgi:hypothetical protein